MKKLFFSLVLLTVASMAFAQNQNNQWHQQREQIRAQRQQMYVARLDSAVVNRNITFTALYMQPTFQGQQEVGPLNNFLTIFPKYLDVALPYVAMFTGLPVPDALDFIAPDYTYGAQLSNGTWTITIRVQNVAGPDSPVENPYTNYTMHLNFSVNNGSATLVVVPDYTTPITYIGNVRIN